MALVRGPAPWTLLTPQWTAWSTWVAPAVVSGLWLGGVGHAQFTSGQSRRPGQTRAPWAGVGAGLFLVTGLALHQASQFETTFAVLGWADPFVGAVLGLAGVSAAATILARQEAQQHRMARMAVGATATMWFAGPALGSLAFGWSTVLPLAMLANLGFVLWRSERPPEPVLWVAGVLLVAVVGLSPPAFPSQLGDAVALGVTLVAAFWLVATRTALAVRRTS